MSDELRKALERKRDSIHPTNRRPGLPIMMRWTFGELEALIEALAASSPPSRSAPDRCVLVPREPTTAMIEAGEQAINAHILGEPNGVDEADACYCAMLAAAPSTPSSTVDEGERPDSCPACGALPCDWVNDPSGGWGAFSGLLGLIDLILDRTDLPADVRAAISTSHRLEAAREALSAPFSTLTRDDDYDGAALRARAAATVDEDVRRLREAVATPAIRDQAFEEAARKAASLAMRNGTGPYDGPFSKGHQKAAEDIAKAIRALKGTPPTDVEVGK